MSGQRMIVSMQPSKLIPDPIADTLYLFSDDALLRRSIAAAGIKEPLIIRPDMTIISGHRRWRIAMDLGLEEVPCIVTDDGVTSYEGRLLIMVAHNIHRMTDPLEQAHVGRLLRPVVEQLACALDDASVTIDVVPEGAALLDLLDEVWGMPEEDLGGASRLEVCISRFVGLDLESFVALTALLDSLEAGDAKASEAIDMIRQNSMTPHRFLLPPLNQHTAYIADTTEHQIAVSCPMIRSSSGELVRYDYADRQDRHAYLLDLIERDLQLTGADSAGASPDVMRCLTSLYVDPGRPANTMVVMSQHGPCLFQDADVATRMRLLLSLTVDEASSEVMEISAGSLVHCGNTEARITCWANNDMFDRFRRGMTDWLEIPVILRKIILF